MNKIVLLIQRPKPRNPLAAASRLRKAGAHRAGRRALRARGRADLRREIEGLRASP